MKKILSLILLLMLTLSIVSCYVGDGWQDTPKKALEVSADATIDDSERLTPANPLDEFYINGNAYMLFVSNGDTLVQATFVTNEKGQYHYHGDTEEVFLSAPDTMVLNGDSEQFILFGYFSDGAEVWGYKYSSVNITVNGVAPETKTYTFFCEDKEWSIDRWWISDIGEDSEINIEYARG